MHSMSKLIQCNNLSEAEHIIESMLILSNSEYIGFDVNHMEIPSQSLKFASLNHIEINEEDTSSDEHAMELLDIYSIKN